MKIISDDRSSYIPLWIYADKNSEGLNKELPFTELGKLFFNELSVQIKYSCISSVNASSWHDFLSKDADTVYSVLTFVLKYLWESDNAGVAFMNRCDYSLLTYNAQILQQIHQKLAEESIDLNSRWRHSYIADMYSEYEDYIIHNCYKSDKSNSRLEFS